MRVSKSMINWKEFGQYFPDHAQYFNVDHPDYVWKNVYTKQSKADKKNILNDRMRGLFHALVTFFAGWEKGFFGEEPKDPLGAILDRGIEVLYHKEIPIDSDDLALYYKFKALRGQQVARTAETVFTPQTSNAAASITPTPAPATTPPPEASTSVTRTSTPPTPLTPLPTAPTRQPDVSQPAVSSSLQVVPSSSRKKTPSAKKPSSSSTRTTTVPAPHSTNSPRVDSQPVDPKSMDLTPLTNTLISLATALPPFIGTVAGGFSLQDFLPKFSSEPSSQQERYNALDVTPVVLDVPDAEKERREERKRSNREYEYVIAQRNQNIHEEHIHRDQDNVLEYGVITPTIEEGHQDNHIESTTSAVSLSNGHLETSMLSEKNGVETVPSLNDSCINDNDEKKPLFSKVVVRKLRKLPPINYASTNKKTTTPRAAVRRQYTTTIDPRTNMLKNLFKKSD